MKTSVNMIRPMGQFEVTQRTKDGMFNATSLLKQWNKDNKSKKEVTKFFERKETKEFLDAMLDTDEFDNTQNLAYLKTRGKNGGTWMHPYLFIDFAMWLNPKFKLEVIKFVYDQLIETRHDAGINFNRLTKSVRGFKGVDYPTIAKGLNWIVFGVHEKNIRNTADQSKLNELTELQKQLSFAIDMGYIKSFNQLLKEMRKLYHNKHTYKINA